MNDILRIARLKIALQRAFLGRAILRVTLFTAISRTVCLVKPAAPVTPFNPCQPRTPSFEIERGPGVDQGKHLWLRYLGRAVERGHFFPSKRRARKKYKKCGL